MGVGGVLPKGHIRHASAGRHESLDSNSDQWSVDSVGGVISGTCICLTLKAI